MSGAIIYKCPNCGGPVKYRPEKKKYACEYCLSEFDSMEEAGQEGTAADEEAGREGITAKEKAARETAGPEPVLYNCPSCGAEIVTDGTTAATFCYYCHNPVILSGRLSGEYHPDHVIPFDVDKAKAMEIFNRWMKKKRYVPKAFYNEDQVEKISGVYFPYMLYSCQAKGSLEARGDRLRVWVAGNLRYTETQTYDIRRQGDMPVKFVPRGALKKASRTLAEGVFPYDMEKIKPFSMSYLSGFMAERRDMDEKDFNEDVKLEVRSFAEASLKNSIPAYESVQVKNSRVSLEDEKWEYALLPVWTLTYHEGTKDKMYYFTINGQTGKVCGELPVDKAKLMLLFAEIFLPVFIALLIVGYLI